MHKVMLVIFCAVFMIYGLTCLIWPHTIQRYALRETRSYFKIVERLNSYLLFGSSVKSPKYIFQLRMAGLIFIGISIIILATVFLP